MMADVAWAWYEGYTAAVAHREAVERWREDEAHSRPYASKGPPEPPLNPYAPGNQGREALNRLAEANRVLDQLEAGGVADWRPGDPARLVVALKQAIRGRSS